ncbi:MAG: efflux RND transporter periplasmic adaptor subunit, partial [Sphaerochaetaceae bacterium]|nr:efflux RND transporter periplasmic adaptor subunit [Sphaerochaetaceae bacterium]
NVINVEVKKIEPQTFIRTANMTGELVSRTSAVSIFPDVSGKVVEVLVSKGDTVKEGEVLLRVDPSVPGSSYKIRDVSATVGGTILTLNAYLGQKVSSSTAVAELGDPLELILGLYMPEKYLKKKKKGTEAVFTTAAWPEISYPAEVFYIADTVSTDTRTVISEFNIDQPDEKLKAGMFVKAKLVTEKLDGVFTVPTAALSTYLGDTTVYTLDGNKAVRTVVTTGSSNDFETVVTSGLKAGDTVVTIGTVTDGSTVNVIN